MTSENLLSTFGMVEMEAAAARILDVLDAGARIVRVGDMSSEIEINGFLHLIYNGWLENAACCGKAAWLPKPSFYERIACAHPEYKPAHTPKTAGQLLDEMFPKAASKTPVPASQ